MVLRDSCFNLAHWVFCFKYWIIALEIEGLLTRTTMTACKVKGLKLLNYSMIFLQVVFPVLYGLSYCYYSLSVINQTFFSMAFYNTYLTTRFSSGAFLIIAAGFLIDSIRRFRNAIKLCELIECLNEKVMIGHACALFLYIGSVVLYDVAFTYALEN